jgi:hypothetical protein
MGRYLEYMLLPLGFQIAIGFVAIVLLTTGYWMLMKVDVVPMSASRAGDFCCWIVRGLLSTIFVSDKSGNTVFTRLFFAITVGTGSTSFPLGQLMLPVGCLQGCGV